MDLFCYVASDTFDFGGFMIQITEAAAKRIRYLREEESRTELDMLRVEIKKGGCSGLSYKMRFDNEAQSTDKVFEMNGAKLVVDSQSFMYIIGMTLDYSGGLNGKGFVFDNPNANKKCGCGTSFNV